MRIPLLICLGLVAALAQAATPDLRQFSYAQRLRLEGSGAAYRLQLPARVYAGLTRDDYGDLRVFNAAGQLVPYRLRLPVARAQASGGWVEPPFFPLRDAGDARRVLDLAVRRGERVERLTVDRRAAKSAAWGYLIDLGPHPPSVDRLRLVWTATSDRRGFITRVQVDASNNLEDWHTLVAGATVAELVHNGRVLRRDVLKLAGQGGRYLRLRLLNKAGVPPLKDVRVRPRQRQVAPQLALLKVAVRPGKAPVEYLFDLPGALPVFRLRIAPASLNSAAYARVFARRSVAGTWVLQRSVELFRLADGGHEVSNPDIEFPGLARRHWRIQVDRSGGGLGGIAPQVEVYWQPHRLTFLARGPAPYTLAWGSVHVDRGNGGLRLPTVVTVQPAQLAGPVSRPGGAAALSRPTDWKTVLLWLVLSLGALLMAWMGLRLLRQMDRD